MGYPSFRYGRLEKDSIGGFRFGVGLGGFSFGEKLLTLLMVPSLLLVEPEREPALLLKVEQLGELGG
jgi:hypothetical protein